MITMTLPVAASTAPVCPSEAVAPTYARAWKQRRRPAPSLGGFRTDNSTGVSEVECRHT